MVVLIHVGMLLRRSSKYLVCFSSYCRHSVLVFSPQGITVISLLTSTVLFATIWAATNYMYARALLTIAATDVTALFSSAPAFVFLFSICVLKEPPLVLRVRSCKDLIIVTCAYHPYTYIHIHVGCLSLDGSSRHRVVYLC